MKPPCRRAVGQTDPRRLGVCALGRNAHGLVLVGKPDRLDDFSRWSERLPRFGEDFARADNHSGRLSQSDVCHAV